MSIELTDADSGTTRSVRVGERATVRLPENPTTGYRWQAEFDEAALRIVEDRYDGPESPRGAGGHRVLTVEPLRAGTTRLRLANRRSWGDGDPIAEFVVDLGADVDD